VEPARVLFLGDNVEGVLIVVVDAVGAPVAAFHTAQGSMDPQTLGPLDDLGSLCAADRVLVRAIARELS